MEPDRTHMGIQLQGSQPGWSEEEGPGARGAHVESRPRSGGEDGPGARGAHMESRPRSGGEEGPGARGARVERGPGLVLARATAAPGPHFSLCSPSAVFLSKDTPQSQKALEMLQEPSPSGEPHTLRVLRSPAIEKHEKRGFPGGSVVTNLPPVRVPSPVWEDATYLKATKPTSHSCEPVHQSPGGSATEGRALQPERPPQGEARTPQHRGAPAHCN